MVAAAINSGAAAVLGDAGMSVTPASVRAHRRTLRLNRGAATTEMSPLEAVTVALSMIDDELTDPSNPIPVWTSYRFALESSLKDENSVASWLAHRWLSTLGLRR
jgi:hypothetical protein